MDRHDHEEQSSMGESGWTKYLVSSSSSPMSSSTDHGDPGAMEEELNLSNKSNRTPKGLQDIMDGDDDDDSLASDASSGPTRRRRANKKRGGTTTDGGQGKKAMSTEDISQGHRSESSGECSVRSYGFGTEREGKKPEVRQQATAAEDSSGASGFYCRKYIARV